MINEQKLREFLDKRIKVYEEALQSYKKEGDSLYAEGNILGAELSWGDMSSAKEVKNELTLIKHYIFLDQGEEDGEYTVENKLDLKEDAIECGQELDKMPFDPLTGEDI